MFNLAKSLPLYLSKTSLNANHVKSTSLIKHVTSSHLHSTQNSHQLEQNIKNNDLVKTPLKKVIYPLKHDDFFNVNELINLEELFKARVHYGHHAGLRCPWMSEYIYGTRINTDIIDLEKSIPPLRKALNFIAHIAFRKGVILFITRYAQHIPVVERTALEVGEYSHCKQWNNGTFTDSTRRFGSVIRLPDLCVFLHTHEKLNEPHGALAEAAKMLIPTVAICDTDIDPSQISYPIPGNDDSMVSLQLYTRLIKKVILNAKKKRQDLESEGYVIQYE